jgi:endonuclease III-like uncharacterized protein
VPKSVRVKLGEDDGMFEYLVQKDQFGIMLRSRLLIKRALFASEEYEDLRNFFTFVVQKHSEQVVIKKAKP